MMRPVNFAGPAALPPAAGAYARAVGDGLSGAPGPVRSAARGALARIEHHLDMVKTLQARTGA